ncbi:MAG: RNA polymerase sigma factor [Acidobacteriaceae bacterium]
MSSLRQGCRQVTFKRFTENLSPLRVFLPQHGVHTKDTMAHTHAASLAQIEQAQQANAAIAAGLRRHDPDLMEQLIEMYQHRLFRYLLFLTGNRDLSQDLFQETWLRVLERGSQYNGRARFDTWMFTIARNLMIDSTRKRQTISLDEATAPEAQRDQGRPLDVAADAPSPFDHFQSQEQAARIGQALLGLPPLYREVLVLRFHEGLSLEEISRVSSAPLSTVKSRLYRGMAALRPVLQAGHEGPGREVQP